MTPPPVKGIVGGLRFYNPWLLSGNMAVETWSLTFGTKYVILELTK